MMRYKKLNIKSAMMKKVRYIHLAAISFLLVQTQVQAQFIGTETDSSATIEEVRKGSVVEYSLESPVE